jgi:hypothetical protein
MPFLLREDIERIFARTSGMVFSPIEAWSNAAGYLELDGVLIDEEGGALDGVSMSLKNFKIY